ncbi:hypothetical protein GSI_10245 [Ganoderma sinense ZZ0214-1]|uniref:Uncharacterized protein n=1 Tax=Ganoderma sinense ZZ0214-1 TaxID=1077348 RepID=A0A2G8S031_9APHY|nr:hypothetical protein GSI_10245 [Ganoderma sinense ZZ0214-1]
MKTPSFFQCPARIVRTVDERIPSHHGARDTPPCPLSPPLTRRSSLRASLRPASPLSRPVRLAFVTASADDLMGSPQAAGGDVPLTRTSRSPTERTSCRRPRGSHRPSRTMSHASSLAHTRTATASRSGTLTA